MRFKSYGIWREVLVPPFNCTISIDYSGAYAPREPLAGPSACRRRPRAPERSRMDLWPSEKAAPERP